MRSVIYKELLEAISKKSFWLWLPVFDLKLKYRRTKLGPLWNVLTILLTVVLMSLAWSQIFKMDLKTYLPKLYFGMTAWVFIASMITQSSTLLTNTYGEIIRNLRISIFSCVFRSLFFNLYTYFHYCILLVIFIIIFNIKVTIFTLMFIPSLILVMINYVWISALMSSISARFRDLVPLSESFMNAGTLLTPIVWSKEQLGKYENFVYLNPFTFFVEALREPLIGNYPGHHVYIGLILFALIGWTTLGVFLKYKINRIIYWSH